ncbi:MAG: histidine kinase [Synechococcales cyanobacterium K44_A2020_017]|nr:histidine kinase [Synechococcales cyanobacterium K32_A2020_035]MBF2093879.1 histidine kinase [Synechococcales cyanobacterium K44_A2020_017]
MLEKHRMEALNNSQETLPQTAAVSLQLLLFVDKRPYSAEKIRQIRSKLKELPTPHPVDLHVVDVSEQPHLAEHFKLVATPTLIKLFPEPRQMLAGTNLVAQIGNWWERWQRSLDDIAAQTVPEESKPSNPAHPTEAIEASPTSATLASVAHSAELIQLSDEIFQLRQEKEDLQEQVLFKDRLISMLAHDLRNPITAVSIALETLEMGFNTEASELPSRFTPELMAQLLKHARTQTKAVDRMIADVLQVARGQGAGFQIQPQRLDLGDLCYDVLSRLNAQVQRKSQQIEADIPSDLPRVYADPERVEQVLMNLLDNAIKYTPVSGSIRLTILHRTTQKVQVSICDDGPGIPEENCDRIFEDRFRLERDESKDGYGIGLSLCQRVIRAHYGQIWVDSVPSQGSCFHFTLPVYRS